MLLLDHQDIADDIKAPSMRIDNILSPNLKRNDQSSHIPVEPFFSPHFLQHSIHRRPLERLHLYIPHRPQLPQHLGHDTSIVKTLPPPAGRQQPRGPRRDTFVRALDGRDE